jgi:cell division protein FtsW (lipid II flippase)
MSDLAAALFRLFIYCLGLVQRAKDRFGALLVFGMTAIFSGMW